MLRELIVLTEILSWARRADRKDGYMGVFYADGICGENQRSDGGVCEL